MKKLKSEWNKWIELFVFAVAIIIAYKLISNFEFFTELVGKFIKVIMPFFIGIVIAYFLNPPCTKLQKVISKCRIKFIARKATGISVLTVYLFILFIIILALSYILPPLGRNITELAILFPQYIINFIDYLNNLEFDNYFINIDWQSVLNSFSIQEMLSKIGISIASISVYAVSMTTGIINAFISIVISIYVLLYKESLLISFNSFVKSFVKESVIVKAKDFLKRSNDIFYRFIFTQFLDACILGTLATIVLSIIGVEYAITLGILLLVCNMIPYFGSIFATAIAVIVTMLSDGGAAGVITGISLTILQQIDGNIISPKLMGNSFKINPIWVILAISIGGSYFGVIGMFVSVPVAVILKTVISNFIEMRVIGKKKEAD